MAELPNLLIPKFIDAALTPVAREAGERLADLINLVFTPVIMARQYRDLRLNNFFEKLDAKLKKIPKDKVCNPPLSVVGPVLDDVSKYYYEDEHLRDMFSSLIASAMNIDFTEIIHPSFKMTIEQLSPKDAYLIKKFRNVSFHSYTCKFDSPIAIEVNDVVDYTTLPYKYTPFDFSNSIAVLRRLDLIYERDRVHGRSELITKEMVYDELVARYGSIYEIPSIDRLNITEMVQRYVLTEYAKNLLQVCLGVRFDPIFGWPLSN